MKIVKAVCSKIAVLLLIATIFVYSSPQAQITDILIADLLFIPSDVTINVGTTVRWTNIDPVLHSATSDGNWDSGLLDEFETYEFTFNSTGTFDYYCTQHPFMTGTITVQQPTDAEESANSLIPRDFRLFQNYPNPFNPSTTIEFSLERRSEVKLTVFSILGTEVKTLANAEFAAGRHSLEWDGTDAEGSQVSSGIYFYQIESNGIRAAEKMVLLK